MIQFFAKTDNLENIPENFTEGFFYEIELTARYVKQLALELFKKLEIEMSVSEFIVLDILTYSKEVCQRDIAKKIFKDRATTGKILDSLEKRGLIERVIDTKNNRLVKKIKINKDGLKIAKEINKKLEKTKKMVDEKISQKDKNGVVNSLRTIRKHLDEILHTQI